MSPLEKRLDKSKVLLLGSKVRTTWKFSRKVTLTMYMGEPHNVAAIILFCRYRANPKSAAKRNRGRSGADTSSGEPAPSPVHSSYFNPINLCSLYPVLVRLWQLFLSSSILVLVTNAQYRHYKRTEQAPTVPRWTNSHPSVRDQNPFAWTEMSAGKALLTSVRMCQFICCCLSLSLGNWKLPSIEKAAMWNTFRRNHYSPLPTLLDQPYQNESCSVPLEEYQLC